jgi:hypothetical protein
MLWLVAGFVAVVGLPVALAILFVFAPRPGWDGDGLR